MTGRRPPGRAGDTNEHSRSTDQGQVEAQEVLGGIYFFGKGVSVDYAKAAKWYELAADQGIGGSVGK